MELVKDQVIFPGVLKTVGNQSAFQPQSEGPIKKPLGPFHTGLLQRKCACGGSPGTSGECEECSSGRLKIQRRSAGRPFSSEIPPIVHETLRSPGRPLDPDTRAFMEQGFGHDFSNVRIHDGYKAEESARAVHALAYTVGSDIVFGAGQFVPSTPTGRHLIAHELTHVLQQSSFGTSSIDNYDDGSLAEEANADAVADAVLSSSLVGPIGKSPAGIQRRAAPYIKKVKVHLNPPQKAELEWEGTPPEEAAGKDSFTVSTGKGYSNPDDPPGTCRRQCCSDPTTQCAPPWNKPENVGACCTYYGSDFWTGTPLDEHNGWKWWTPIQPYYSIRGIALHQHDTVTGQPIGHGCVRMEEPNAKRIFDYSNGKQTNVTIDGRAAPVDCDDSRRCSASTGERGALEQGMPTSSLATAEEEPIPGQEGVLT